MTYTTNYNLNKPAGSDYVNIADLNSNMDTIDSTLFATTEQALANKQTLDNLTTFIPISESIVASSGDLDIVTSSIDWSKYQEVHIFLANPPAWSTVISVPYKRIAFKLNSLENNMFYWSPTQSGYISGGSGSAGYLFFELSPNAGTDDHGLVQSDFHLILYPQKSSTNKVRLKCIGPLHDSNGGSDTVTYANLAKIVCSGGSGMNLTGATIKIYGVN